MFRRVALVLVVLSTMVHPAVAQQTVNFTVGAFVPRAEDARVDGDVLVANREFLSFDIKDFTSATFGGEWLFPVGNFVEGGVGVGYYQRGVPSVYTDYVANDGTEVEQELKLRVVPVAFTVRLLPLGQSSPVQPYVGGGLGIFRWKYTETGDFIDFGTPFLDVFPGTFEASGSETGPIVLGGLRFVGDGFSVGGEVRYQRAEGELPDGFAGRALDLGGWSYQGTFGVRFGR